MPPKPMTPEEKAEHDAAIAQVKEISTGVATALVDEKLGAAKTSFEAELKKKTEALEQTNSELKAKVEELETKYKGVALVVPDGSRIEVPGRKFSLGRALWYKLSDKSHCPSECELEKKVLDETEKKAIAEGSLNPGITKVMNTQAGTLGSFLMPEQFINELIDELKDRFLLAELGVQFMEGLTGAPVRIPTKTSGTTAYMLSENEAPTASELALGQELMVPHTMGVLSKISNRLSLLALPSVERLLRKDIIENMQLKMMQQAFRGKGVNSEVLGLTNQAGGLNTVNCGTGGNGGAIDMAKLHAFISSVEQDLALKDSACFIFNTRTIDVIRQLKDQENRYFFRPDAWDAAKPTILGHRFFTTNQIPNNLTVGATPNCTEIYFGVFSEMIVGIWRNMAIRILDQASDSAGNNAALNDQLWFLSFMDFDMCLKHDKSFAISTDCSS